MSCTKHWAEPERCRTLQWTALILIAIAVLAMPQAVWADCPDFASAVNYPAGTTPLGVAVGDFNGDGKADLAVTDRAEDEVAIRLGNGDGTFGAPVNYATNASPRGVAIGDFDRDGDADLAIANADSGNVSIRLGIGNGTFGSAVSFTTAASPRAVAVGDFDRDGRPDLAMASFIAGNSVSILVGNGDGTFDPYVAYDGGDFALSIAIGDFNRDGKPDFVTGNEAEVSIVLGNGDGTFASPNDFGSNGGAVAVGDLNGDGTDDVVTTAGSGAAVLLGNGDGTLGAEITYPAVGEPGGLTIGDFDGDGNLDLAVSNVESDSISVLTGSEGDGTFDPAVHFVVGISPDSAAAADFDGNGTADLAVAIDGNVSILLNSRICNLNCATFTAAPSPTVGTAPQSMVSADFNRDGSADLAVANNGSDTVSILLGIDEGAFAPAVNLSTLSSPTAVASGDVNRDGMPDLFIGRAASSDNVAVRLGNGDGTFAAASNYTAGISVEAITSGDLNRDGKLDLVVSSANGNTVSVLLGFGDGTLAPASSYATGLGSRSIVISDFSDDGKPDLAVTNADTNTVSILLGNGDGSFATATSWTVGAGPESVVAADFNRDGRLDLATANADAGTISMRLGFGDGTFVPAVNFTSGSGPFSLVAGDYDADGLLDLAVANIDSDDISILMGNGNGTFDAPVLLSVGSEPRALVNIHLRGSGRPHLAVANQASNNLSVILNLCPEPDLVVNKSHSGDFTQGQTAATYIITVSNDGGDGPTIGTVTVVDTLPPGLTATSLSGTGWACTLGTLTCTRSDTIEDNASFPPITLTVDVAVDAPALVTNTVTVSGVELNEGNNDDSDPTTVIQFADLTITKTHAGTFTQGDTGRTYTISVKNSGLAPTSGTVTVTDTLPAGLTATALTGSGWSCTLGTLTCTRSDVLAAGEIWPPIFITVTVANDAPFSVTNTVTVSGGGEVITGNNSASDPTVIYDNLGCGTFASAVNLAADEATFVAVGDFNGDGDSDLAVTNDFTKKVLILLGNGDGTFAAAVDYPTGTDPEWVATGDFDGDGDVDLAIADSGSTNVSILLGDGNGAFAAPATYSIGGSGITSVAVGDFNGDGKDDVAATNPSLNRVEILLGYGDGTLAAAVSYATGSTPFQVAVGDFNGDGIADLAVANSVSVSVLIGNGDGTFDPQVSYASGQAKAVAIADFNADGKSDLAVANDDVTDTISILLGNGDGTFGAATYFPSGSYPNFVATGDFNGDGKTDLAVANEDTPGSVTILLGNGDGTLASGVTYPTGDATGSVAIADFNGDGRADLAASNEDTDNVSILLATCPPPDLALTKTHTGDFLRGQSGATYTITASNAGVGPTAGTVTVVDTLPTGLTATALSGNGWNCTLGTLTCTRTDTLGPTMSYPAITLTVDVAFNAAALVTNVADISGTDANGANNTASDPTTVLAPDLTIAKTHTGAFTRGATGKTYSLVVKNNGTGATNGTVTVTDALPAGLTATALSGTGWSCTLGTLICTRNDALAPAASWPPIVLTVSVDANAPFSLVNSATVTVSGEVNTGDNTADDPTTVRNQASCETFAPAVSFGTGDSPRSVVVADFDDDGDADLAVANAIGDSVSVLLGNGNGTFGAKTDYATGDLANSIAAGDFDNDGELDLAVANRVSDTVSIFIGNGDGTFDPAVNYPAGDSAYAVALADTDLDGSLDLIVISSLGDSIGILLGNGNGTFGAAVSYPVGDFPVALQSADFDGDGNPDVAVANIDSNNVSILLGNGDGTFDAAVNYSSGDPNSIAVHDLDGDGAIDLAVVNRLNDNVSIRKGNGNGTFGAAANYTTGALPLAVTIDDFNGDGNADLAVAEEGDNVSIRLGNGNGTFGARVSYAAGDSPIAVAAADLNGDGKADLVVVDKEPDTVSILFGACPDLTISKTHAGDFTQGQIGATYTLTVTNAGLATTAGTVTVTDTLPSPLTATAIGGTGWDCTLGTLTCTRSDALGAGASYPDITLTVDVSVLAPALVTNTANVSGSGESLLTNNAASDPTTIAQFPDLAVTKTHIGSFTQGKSEKTYTLSVRNVATPATSGTVTVTDTLPAGLTATAISGSGWSCDLGTLTCTRSDALAGGAIWPPITLTVDVDSDAPFSATNIAAVSGGGELNTANSSATDPTVIISSESCGTLGVSVAWAVGNAPRSVAIDDFDGDGNNDFAAVNASDDNVSIRLGNGDGTFGPAVNYAMGDFPTSIAFGDFNGDGARDLAVANRDSDNVSVRLGIGDGTFGARTNHSVENAPVSIAAGDFNGDGMHDLATANSDSDNVSVLLSIGSGTFAAKVNYTSGLEPVALALGDFNGDGKSDMVAANNDSSYVSVRLGNGDGTFGASLTYAVGAFARALAIGDFDDDGKADIAVAHDFATYVSILLGNGDGTFDARVRYTTGSGPISLAIGDFNGDATDDLAITQDFDVEILFGNGDGTFSAGVSYPMTSATLQLASGDFNGDGKFDVAVASPNLDAVSILLGGCPDLTISKSHSGTFTQGQSGRTYTLTVSNAGAISTGTVTVTDTLPASLTATAIGGFGWSCNLGTLTCTRSSPLAPGVSYSVITVTVNVSVTAPANVTNTAAVSGGGELNTTNNGASDPTTIIPLPDLAISKTHSGDFAQGDVGQTYTITVSNGGSDGPTKGTVTVTDTLPAGLTATAMSGTGWNCVLGTLTCTRSDVLAPAASYPAITLTVNVSRDAAANAVNMASVSVPSEIATANNTANDPTTITQLPDLSIVTTHLGGFTQGDDGKAYTIAVRNIGVASTAGTVTVTDTLPAGLTATAMSGTGWACTLGTLTCTRADALGVGATWPPIVLTVSVGNDAPYALTNIATVSSPAESNAGNNTASDPTVIFSNAQCASFAPAVSYATGLNPVGVVAGKFDGDGIDDLVVVNSTGDTVSVLLGNGNGTFDAGVSYAAGDAPNYLATADFNGDQKNDLAVALVNADAVAILLGNGDGSFGAPVEYEAGDASVSVAAGDFDGDGNTDLAVANVSSGDISILLGNGDGTFQDAVNYALGADPRFIIVADLSGDGKQDLAVPQASSVKVLLGNGDGTFATAVTYNVGATAVSVAAGDLDGDGIGDLVVSAINTISVFLGNGDGTFPAAINHAVAGTLFSLAIADFDGDGKSDLAGTDASLNTVSILLGNGDATFGAPSTNDVGTSPRAVATGDFNGDGKADVAATNFGSHNASVLLNICSDLTISKTHSGNFTEGQSGATYALTVTNAGLRATQGVVTVTDTLPASLTATAISGTGWSCTLGTLTCTRIDVLAAGASYPDIMLTVAVSITAPALVTNTASVSGGGEVDTTNNSAGDPTTIVLVPELSVTKTHSSNFAPGQTGRTYTITVSNSGGGATSGTVTVVDTLPTGLTATAMSGSGWACVLGTRTCTRSDALTAGASYPPITLTVTVNNDAPASLVNTVNVSVAGELITTNNTANDPTTVLIAPQNLVATALSTTQVSLTWNAVVGATNYQLYRSANNGPFVQIAFPSTNSFLDNGVTPSTSYVYYARATDTANLGPAGNKDVATTILFTDDPIVPAVTKFKAVHLVELRTAVNAIRAAAGLTPATFTDTLTAGVVIKAIHITELRTALNPARSTLGLTAITYTDPTVVAGITAKTAHVRDLRLGVK